MGNKKFDEFKSKHPEWSDEQIWTAVSIDMQSDTTIEEKGKDVNPNDPDILKQILIGAKKWLQDVLPVIFEKIKAFFEDLISSFEKWVKKGIDYILEAIGHWRKPSGMI
jgi:hypothetical protein